MGLASMNRIAAKHARSVCEINDDMKLGAQPDVQCGRLLAAVRRFMADFD